MAAEQMFQRGQTDRFHAFNNRTDRKGYRTCLKSGAIFAEKAGPFRGVSNFLVKAQTGALKDVRMCVP